MASAQRSTVSYHLHLSYILLEACCQAGPHRNEMLHIIRQLGQSMAGCGWKQRCTKMGMTPTRIPANAEAVQCYSSPPSEWREKGWTTSWNGWNAMITSLKSPYESLCFGTPAVLINYSSSLATQSLQSLSRQFQILLFHSLLFSSALTSKVWHL